MRIGIIDLGTNTFNLLIVETKKGKPFTILLNTKLAVMLGSGGLNSGIISEEALNRAYGVLSKYRELLNKYNCGKVLAFGTSAIRSTSNSKQFIEKIATDLNIHIESISGDQEAEYIYHGVRASIEFTDENYLILDFGGGSNEFIIANKNGMLWKHSFPLGGARLLEKFKPSNPISENEIELLNIFLDSELQQLKEALKKFPITKLVGSSGAFDSFADVIYCKNTGLPQPKDVVSSRISLEEFEYIYSQIVKSSRQERLLIPGLEAVRVETIVMATLFSKFSLELSGANEIIQSTFSLKEGVAALFSLQ
jgi:exopolyphosphatase/guanosine-5'-triphosphate,3'-diphosphate pyrophosphatase